MNIKLQKLVKKSISILLIVSLIVGIMPADALEDTEGSTDAEVRISDWEQLLAEFSEDGSTITIPEGKVVYIDKTLSIPSTGEFTITGGGSLVKGTISNNYFLQNSGATLNLNNITLDGKSEEFSQGIISTGGTININGATIQGFNYTRLNSNFGAAIKATDTTINFKSGTIQNNVAAYAGAIALVSNSTLNITGGTLSGNIAESSGQTGKGGGAINVDGGSSVYMTSGTITGNRAYRGGGICIANGSVEISGGTITGNTASNRGGGVYLNSGAINMIGGNIVSNTTDGTGAGISIQEATATITGGKIEGNIATNDGGGIYITGGTLTIGNKTSAPLITKNEAGKFGGGIGTYSGKVEINNTTVNYNSAQNGGGVYTNSGHVNINNSRIESNTATEGGGVYKYTGSNLNIKDTTITNNVATEYGGGINAARSGEVILSNTSITNNTAGKAGGGTYNTAVTKISDKIIISGNTLNSTANTENNVYLNGKEGLVVTGALSEASKIGVSYDWAQAGHVVAQPGNDYTMTDLDRAKFSEDTNQYKIVETTNSGIQNFVLGEKTYRVYGTVRDSNTGNTIPEATITAKGLGGKIVATVTTKADGTYEVTGLSNGNYTFELIYENNTKAEAVSIEGQDKQVDIGLPLPFQPKNYKIYGTVTDKDTASPLSEAVVTIYDITGGKLKETKSQTSGYYEFTDLANGVYTVKAVYYKMTGEAGSAAGGMERLEVTKTVTIASQDIVLDLTFVTTAENPNPPVDPTPPITTTYKISGTTKSGNVAISNVYIQLIDKATGKLIATTHSNTQGQYEFDNLTPGTYEIRGYTGSTSFKSATITGRDIVVDLEFKQNTTPTNPIKPTTPVTRTYKISGIVRDNKNTSLTAITVRLINPSTGKTIATTHTDSKGYYQFEGLNAKVYKIEATYNDSKEIASATIINRDITVNMTIQIKDVEKPEVITKPEDKPQETSKPVETQKPVETPRPQQPTPTPKPTTQKPQQPNKPQETTKPTPTKPQETAKPIETSQPEPQPTYQITGLVVDSETGNPLPRTPIKVVDQNGKIVGPMSTKDDGTFTISNIPDGEYTITVAYKNPEDNKNITKQVKATIDDSNREIVIQIDIPKSAPVVPTAPIENTEEHSITGEVIDIDNIPLPGAKIEVYDANGIKIDTIAVNDEGSFTISNLPTGIYQLTALYSGPLNTSAAPIQKSITVEIEDSDQETVIKFEESGILVGVTEKFTNSMVRAAMITAISLLSILGIGLILLLLFGWYRRIKLFNDINTDQYKDVDWNVVYKDFAYKEDKEIYCIDIPINIMNERVTDSFKVKLRKLFVKRHNGDMFILKFIDKSQGNEVITSYSCELDKEETEIYFMYGAPAVTENTDQEYRENEGQSYEEYYEDTYSQENLSYTDNTTANSENIGQQD